MSGRRTTPAERPHEKRAAVRKAPVKRKPARPVAAKSPKQDPVVKRGYEQLFELAAEKGMPYSPFGPPILDD